MGRDFEKNTAHEYECLDNGIRSEAEEVDYIAPEEKEKEGQETRPIGGRQGETVSGSKKPPLNERLSTAWRALKGKPAQLPDRDELIRERYKNKTARQSHYGVWLMVTLIVQLLAINAFMWTLLVKNNWNTDSSVIIAFLTSVVAEVIGLVYAVVRATFDRDEDV